MSTEKLLKIKEQIDNAKTEKAKISGQISGVEQQMQSKFNIKGVKAAEKKLAAMGSELDSKEKEFDDGMAELERNFPDLN
jgi:uncharacterized protein (DUF3084 family)